MTDEPTWIVDPLDGTTNFVHGYLSFLFFVDDCFLDSLINKFAFLKYFFNIIMPRFPFVCVSIGLTIGKIPTVGVVYNPIMDEVSVFVLRISLMSAQP